MQANVGMLLKAMKPRKRSGGEVRVEGSDSAAEHLCRDISEKLASIRIQEYWWTDSFVPAGSWEVGKWVATRARKHVWNFAVRRPPRLIKLLFGEKNNQPSKTRIDWTNSTTTAPGFPFLNFWQLLLRVLHWFCSWFPSLWQCHLL